MHYDVARYLGIDSAFAPSFSADGDHLAFLRDTTGTPQVWTLSESKRPPERRTPFDERISVVQWSPTRPEFVFAMDAGSDERDQLYRYDATTGAIRRLTDDPGSTHDWGAWGPQGERIAFAANRERVGRFDVYVQDRTASDDAAELVCEGDGGWLSVAGWHPDGDRLMLTKPNASFDDDLYVLDVESGTRTRLSDDSAATYDDVHVGAAGEWAYCVTNYERDTAYVGRVHLDSGNHEMVVKGGDWDVDGLAIDRSSGAIAYSRNVDGYSEVFRGRVSGTRTSGMAQLDLPRGVATGLTFAPDGDRLAFTFSSNDIPKGVYVAENGAYERWTPAHTMGIPRPSFQRASVVRYESFDGREIPAYWTPPAEWETGETPVIVDVHGGPEHQRRPWFYPTKQYFVNRGYAVFEPNVRGSTGYGTAYTHLDDVEKRMDSVRDLEYAYEWLSSREAVDEDRVVIYGRSYGGFMVLAAITQFPDLWAAAVEFVGIANFVTFLENTGDWRRSHREAEYGSLADDRDLLEEISPIHDVDRVQCPLFVQHGANDPRVPVGESRQIADALAERGVPVETCIFDDEGHHTTSRENQMTQFERIAAFLDEHVRG